MEYIPVINKFDKLEDPDILRLAQVKDLMFPIYNYEKLISETKRCDEGAAGFGDEKEAAITSVKKEIQRAKMAHMMQMPMINEKQMTGELNLPSVSTVLKVFDN
jgi:hypothetical protein